jgi:hypothetical protein
VPHADRDALSRLTRGLRGDEIQLKGRHLVSRLHPLRTSDAQTSVRCWGFGLAADGYRPRPLATRVHELLEGPQNAAFSDATKDPAKRSPIN